MDCGWDEYLKVEPHQISYIASTQNVLGYVHFSNISTALHLQVSMDFLQNFKMDIFSTPQAKSVSGIKAAMWGGSSRQPGNDLIQHGTGHNNG